MKKWAVVGILVVVLYAASYIPLSWGGRIPTSAPGYIGPVYWHPIGMVNHERLGEEPSLNVVGYLYYPMVVADWALVHKPYHRC